MQHRHLNHSNYTLAAIDDVIERGNLRDWVELARAVLGDETGVLREKVLRVSRARDADNPQAFRVWQLFAERREIVP
jgi:hypothetical protein